MALSKDLVAASAIPLVLGILGEGENYGYAIIKRVHELSDGRMEWTDGMLYPVLHRLEKQGCIASRWDTAKTGRKRKYYRLKSKGSRILRVHREQWGVVNTALQRLLEAQSCSI